jgi:hypothetical protein
MTGLPDVRRQRCGSPRATASSGRAREFVQRCAGESAATVAAMLRLTCAVVLAVAGLGACSGRSCDDLDDLRAQRDQARLEASESLKAPAGPDRDDKVERTHDRMHSLERTVFDLEESCS